MEEKVEVQGLQGEVVNNSMRENMAASRQSVERVNEERQIRALGEIKMCKQFATMMEEQRGHLTRHNDLVSGTSESALQRAQCDQCAAPLQEDLDVAMTTQLRATDLSELYSLP